MPNPNMTYEELREQISKEMGYWSPDGFDAYPEKTDKVLQLFATFMDNLLTNAVVEKNFTKEVDAYIKKVRAEFGPLTTKNTEEENV